MDLFTYLEGTVKRGNTFESYVLPSLLQKTTLWVPVHPRYVKKYLTKEVVGYHQVSDGNLPKLLKLQGKRNAVSVFTSTNNVENFFKQSIGSGGYGLVVKLSGVPLVSFERDAKTRVDSWRGDRWFNLYNLSPTATKQVKEVLNSVLTLPQDTSKLSEKEKNTLISKYYKAVWGTLNKHSVRGLFSKLSSFSSNSSNTLRYNEVLLHKVKVLKLYYSSTNLNTGLPHYGGLSNVESYSGEKVDVSTPQGLQELRNDVKYSN